MRLFNKYFNSFAFLCAMLSSALIISSGLSYGASNTITYTYDALGRLTFVNDQYNGNRDYDYDKAGNRLLVSTGTPNDAAAEPAPPGQPPVPAPPTGLSSNQNSFCSWTASWAPSSGAASYNFSDVSGNHLITVTTTQVVYGFSSCSIAPSSEKPKWVQACNSVGGCSAKSNFP